MCHIPLLNCFCRESYNPPEMVYRQLKLRGLDLVTVTDHDSYAAVEHLGHYPDFFPGVEVTCQMPSGTCLHVGVYGLSERQHFEIQSRRNDMPSLVAYLSEKRLFATANHVFSKLTGRRDASDLQWIAEYFPAVETRNGQMLHSANRRAAMFARKMGKSAVGGSDAHAPTSLGTAYTEVPGARTKEEFLDGLRYGASRARGESGAYSKLTQDVFWIAFECMREQPWTTLLAPLLPLIPLWTLANYSTEWLFARDWERRWPQLIGRHPPIWATRSPFPEVTA
jgi:predicted metal-dependent phosphoesterase TrpH